MSSFSNQGRTFNQSPFYLSHAESHLSTKEQRIREYLGISANISDHDFELFQNDIQMLTETVGVSTEQQIPVRETRPNIPAPPIGRPRRIPNNTSDTEESDNEDFNSFYGYYPGEIDHDEELEMISNFEQGWFQVAWRWSWLQLNINQIQHHLLTCDEQLAELHRQKLEYQKQFESTQPIEPNESSNTEITTVEGGSTQTVPTILPYQPSLPINSLESMQTEESIESLRPNDENSANSQRCKPVTSHFQQKLIKPDWNTVRLQFQPAIHPLWNSNGQINPTKPFSGHRPLFEQRPDTLPPAPAPVVEVKPPEPDRERERKRAEKKKRKRDRARKKEKRRSDGSHHSSQRKKKKLRSSLSSSRSRLKSSSNSNPRKSSDFDINNVVLPNMGAVRKVRKIKYREIYTPSFRLSSDAIPSDESSEEENTDEEFYITLHEKKEKEEHQRFAPPQKKKARKHRRKKKKKKLSRSAQQVPSSPTLLSMSPPRISLICSTSTLHIPPRLNSDSYLVSNDSIRKPSSDTNGFDHYGDVSTEEEDNMVGDGMTDLDGPSCPVFSADTESDNPEDEDDLESSQRINLNPPAELGKRPRTGGRWIAFKKNPTSNFIHILKSTKL